MLMDTRAGLGPKIKGRRRHPGEPGHLVPAEQRAPRGAPADLPAGDPSYAAWLESARDSLNPANQTSTTDT